VPHGLGPGVIVLSAGLFSPAAGPGTTASPYPIRSSIDRAIQQVLDAHLRPCSEAEKQRVPCFPTQVEAQGQRLSVADSIRTYRPDGSPSPGRPPTVGEMAPYQSGAPLSASGAVPLGDVVCSVKSFWKRLHGEGGPYYLYRTWDGDRESPLLTDRELDPEDFATRPDFRYVFVGRFNKECDAVAAWRKATRDAAEAAH
jgi:hypothetical protein